MTCLGKKKTQCFHLFSSFVCWGIHRCFCLNLGGGKKDFPVTEKNVPIQNNCFLLFLNCALSSCFDKFDTLGNKRWEFLFASNV